VLLLSHLGLEQVHSHHYYQTFASMGELHKLELFYLPLIVGPVDLKWIVGIASRVALRCLFRTGKITATPPANGSDHQCQLGLAQRGIRNRNGYQNTGSLPPLVSCITGKNSHAADVSGASKPNEDRDHVLTCLAPWTQLHRQTILDVYQEQLEALNSSL
jgi:hypothetical protein